MYKKIVLSSFVCLGLLLSNVGCGKKTDSEKSVLKTQTSESAKPTDAGNKSVQMGSDVNKNDAQAVVDKLQLEFPQMKVSKIENAPMTGFYQVVADGEVFYVASNAKLMLVGDVIAIDKPQKANLTEDVRKTSRFDLVNAVPESNMVVFNPKGKVEHTVTVFTDVDCGYCRKFHSEMQAYLDKGIKVRYMAFPRAGMDSDSYNKAVTVWCAKDPKKAMDNAKLAGAEAFKADEKLCDKKSMINDSMALVRKLGLNGTPALVLEDGTLIPGYMPADKLRVALDDLASKRKEATASSNKQNTDKPAG